MSGNTIHCGWVSENLLAGNRGELSGTESRSIEDHVATCADCQREQDGMRLLQQAIDSIPTLEPAADSFSKLTDMIETEQPTAPQPRRGVLLSPTLWAGGALAAAAAAVLLFVFLPLSPMPPAPLTAVAGSLTVDGSPATAGIEFTPAKDTRIVTGSLALIAFAAPRAGELTLAAGTTLLCLSEGRYRLESGRMLADIVPGPGAFTFETPLGTLEVTGTKFTVDLASDRPLIAVIEGSVLLRTDGDEIGIGAGTGALLTADGLLLPLRRFADETILGWCSTPTALLSAHPSAGRAGLLLTLANETVRPLVLKPFDPSVGVYALRISRLDGGPDGPEDVKLLEAMLPRRPTERPRVLTLAPGEAYEIPIDPAKLGLSPGRYAVSAVYNPYTKDLPADAWRGVLVSPSVELLIEDERR